MNEQEFKSLKQEVVALWQRVLALENASRISSPLAGEISALKFQLESHQHPLAIDVDLSKRVKALEDALKVSKSLRKRILGGNCPGKGPDINFTLLENSILLECEDFKFKKEYRFNEKDRISFAMTQKRMEEIADEFSKEMILISRKNK